MLNLAYPLARPVLFSMDAELAHERTLGVLQSMPGMLGSLAAVTMGSPDPSLAFEAFGLKFAGPVGLAAGLDKNGVAIPFWPNLGFGFVEVGTVTAHAQPGNPRPRLFRLPSDNALINRMGFNNAGSEALAKRLTELRNSDKWPSVPVGANIGKSKKTPLDEAPGDYATSTRRLKGLADYFTVNVSSPNTPGLRRLQNADSLARVLDGVLANAYETPVVVKFAPDMDPDALAEAVELVVTNGAAGIIATNTTLDRSGLTADPGEPGGLSGAPLWDRSQGVIKHVLDVVNGRVPVIGVGGISTAEHVRELLDAGCVGVQVYTAMIYQGPGLPSRINRELASH